MPNTTPDALPYPDGSTTPYIHLDLEALAEATQVALDGKVDADDTGTVDLLGVITPAANWQIDAVAYRRIGQIAFLAVVATRLTSALTAGSNGDVANTAVLTLPATAGGRGAWPVIGSSPLASGVQGGLVNGVVSTAGVVSVVSLVGSIAVSQQISLLGYYFPVA